MNKQMFINEASLEKVMVFIHYSLAPNVNPCDNVLIQNELKWKSEADLFVSVTTQVSTTTAQVCVTQKWKTTKLCIIAVLSN